MKNKIIPILIAIAILAVGLSIVKSINPKKPEQPKQKPTPVVKVLELKSQEIPIIYTANATLQAKTSATLKPQVNGRVIKLFIEEGQYVKAGQPLAIIQPEKEQYQIESQISVIEQLRANYLNKKAIYERRKQLFEKELIAKEEVDNAKTDMEIVLNQLRSAEATLKEYQRQKNETVVKAPFDGILDKRFISIGDYVDSQTQMFYILKPNPLWAVFSLPQQYIKNIKIRDSIDIDIDGIGKVKGKIDYISSSLDQNNLIVVKALVENPDSKLKENMYGKANIAIDVKKGFRIPEQALLLAGNESFVYKIQDGKAFKVKVDVINQSFGYVDIMGNLQEGDKIAITNLMMLKDGMPVKVIN